MRKFLSLSFAAFALMFLFSAFAVTETKAQPGVLGEVLKRMETHNQALKSLRANVTMEKYNSQLDISDKYEGKVVYLPQKERDPYIRIDWTKPREESLSVFNKQYTLYVPNLKQAIVGSVNSAKGSGTAGGALVFLNMSKAQLKTNYTIRYVGQETAAAVPTWHLELTPKTKTSYKTADLWVDGDGMPIQAKVVENNGDITTVLLSKFDKNGSTIDGSVFLIKYPKDTKIIKG
jgi:outer membrane lipoprotein-sorting protein